MEHMHLPRWTLIHDSGSYYVVPTEDAHDKMHWGTRFDTPREALEYIERRYLSDGLIELGRKGFTAGLPKPEV